MITTVPSRPDTRYGADFSVVIPAYQEESRLGLLLSQFTADVRTKHRIEVIVSDGGSTDRTREIAGGVADTLVEHRESRRQTIAEGRNRGAEGAKGSILVFLNADVTVDDPDRLFAAAAAEFTDPGTVGATCAVRVDPREETRFDRFFHSCFNAWCRGLLAFGAGMGRGECQIVRTELFRSLGGYNEALAAAEDYDLFRRLRRRGRIAYLRGVTVHESPRRYRTLGYPKVLFAWFTNALSVTLTGSSRSKEWRPVR